MHIKTSYLPQIHILEEQVLMDVQTLWDKGDIQSTRNNHRHEGAERGRTPTIRTDPSEASTTR
jgi:hypothetical protein